MASRKSLNRIVLLILAPVLILTGVLGFILPTEISPLSNQPAYNIFHIVFGAIGLLLLIFRYENPIRGFNIGFGLIDIYQVAAAYADLFPEQFFKWTKVDTVMHIIIGVSLVIIGLYGFVSTRSSSKKLE